MFYIELKPKSNNKNIYEGSFPDCRVKFRAPYPKHEISQCINCQKYGHIKSFCFRKVRCVKGAEDHPTINCPCREKSKGVKYVLCEDNHPANYKDCMIYKDLQRNFFQTLQRKVVILESQPRIESANIQTTKIICFSYKNRKQTINY